MFFVQGEESFGHQLPDHGLLNVAGLQFSCQRQTKQVGKQSSVKQKSRRAEGPPTLECTAWHSWFAPDRIRELRFFLPEKRL
jgi:hypothetical protein